MRTPNVVITTGTFLGGEIHLGLKVWPAGRIDENPSIALSKSLHKAGFQLARLKTGNFIVVCALKAGTHFFFKKKIRNTSSVGWPNNQLQGPDRARRGSTSISLFLFTQNCTSCCKLDTVGVECGSSVYMKLTSLSLSLFYYYYYYTLEQSNSVPPNANEFGSP